MTNFNAEAEGVKPDDIIRRLLDTVRADGDAETGKFSQVFRSAEKSVAISATGATGSA